MLRAVWFTRALDQLDACAGIKAGDIPTEYLLLRTIADQTRCRHKVTGIIFDTIDYLRRINAISSNSSSDYVREACPAIAQSTCSISSMRKVQRPFVRQALAEPTVDYTLLENVLAFAAYVPWSSLCCRTTHSRRNLRYVCQLALAHL